MNSRQAVIRAVAVAVFAAGCLPPVAAVAADASYRVVVADADLRSATAVTALYGRLVSAAREVCAFDAARGYAERQRARRCVGATLDSAVTDIRRATTASPALSAEHRAARNRLFDVAVGATSVATARNRD